MVGPPGYCLGHLSSLLQPESGSVPLGPWSTASPGRGAEQGVVVLGVNGTLREPGPGSPAGRQEAGTAETNHTSILFDSLDETAVGPV